MIAEDPWWALARAFGNMANRRCCICGEATTSEQSIEVKQQHGEVLELSWMCLDCCELAE